MTSHPEFPQNYKNILCCNQHIDYVKYTLKHHHISLLGGSNDNLSCNDTNPRYCDRRKNYRFYYRRNINIENSDFSAIGNICNRF